MDLKPLDIILIEAGSTMRWIDPMAWIIHQRTSSWLTHGVIVLNSKGRIVEATGGGVHYADISKYSERKCIQLRYDREFTRQQRLQMLLWAEDKANRKCKYEFKSFLGYLTGIETNYLDDPDQFVCVEFCAEMFTQNGIEIWGCERPTYIYPKHFAMNGCFRKVNKNELVKEISNRNGYQESWRA